MMVAHSRAEEKTAAQAAQTTAHTGRAAHIAEHTAHQHTHTRNTQRQSTIASRDNRRPASIK